MVALGGVVFMVKKAKDEKLGDYQAPYTLLKA